MHCESQLIVRETKRVLGRGTSLKVLPNYYNWSGQTVLFHKEVRRGQKMSNSLTINHCGTIYVDKFDNPVKPQLTQYFSITK